jgi:hypothetical protein
MVAVVARSERGVLSAWRTRAHVRTTDPALRRARIIVVTGIAVWLALAAAVQLWYGAIASVVLVGWGGSIVLCLGYMFGPHAERRVGRPDRSTASMPASEPEPEPAPIVVASAPAPAPEVIDLRDDALRAQHLADVQAAADLS